MKLDAAIRRHGFRRWYSRELTRAHLQLLLLLFCAIGLFAAVELILRQEPWTHRLGNGALLLICLGLGLRSLRRYLTLMMRAEAIAAQAVCSQCQAYGLLEVPEQGTGTAKVAVRCRKCAHAWRIVEVEPGDD